MLASTGALHNQAMLNIFSSLRKNMADTVMSLPCTVSVTDWKNVILGFPAHEFDTKWMITIPMELSSWQLFEAIYAIDEDMSHLPGVPAEEQEEKDKVNGVPTEEQSGAKIYQNEGNTTKKVDLDKVEDSYLKRKGIDAHELKKEIYGKKAKVAEYDIYVNKKTGELYTQRKPQYNKKGEDAIPTGVYIK